MLAVVKLSTSGAWQRLRKIQSRLSVQEGMVSEASRQKTRLVFGAELSPQEVVERIVADIYQDREAALLDYIARLDGVRLTPERLRVSPAEMAAAVEQVEAPFLAAIRQAITNVRAYQTHILQSAPPPLSVDGASLALRQRPLARVGIYIPGGMASYPSSLVMTAVPAQVAGVSRIVVASPCGQDGHLSPYVLATAYELDLTELYKMGGAQAVAALAFGTESVPRVDKIVGPGNLFVNLAKKAVFGQVDIDLLAGPSEIVILADSSADSGLVAADLLAQAEHDPGAAILVTDAPALVESIQQQLQSQLQALSRQTQTRRALEQYGLIVQVGNLEEGLAVVNQWAPEHLHLMVRDPDRILEGIDHAGAIFIGPYTPVAAGDYLAGPSHVLPTGGTARFFSGLSVYDFVKRSSIVRYDRQRLQDQAHAIVTLAEAEGLDGHVQSVRRRLG